MTTRITYAGPPSLAVATATMLADFEGIDLTSSAPPVRGEGPRGTVVLVLMVDGAPEAVEAAVGHLRAGLPPGATIEA
ncbi:MAG: hypothetical protein M3011_02455, partial [Actinomycetota bacterium]|nr:hypothetical protein [Actinomycetota bacterium]